MELPVLDLGEIERREMRSRISLANRPRLNVGGERLSQVAHNLSTRSSDRARFVSDPTAYLKEHSVNVSSCRLVEGVVTQPTEVCTSVVALCVAVLAVVAVAVTVAIVDTKVTNIVSASDGVTNAESPALLNYQNSPFSFGASVI